MPIYETVMQERPPVVLDLGSAYSKIGFAGEPYPRQIIPTVVTLSTNNTTKALFEYASKDELYDQLVDFVQLIFFKHLLVSPKERKVIIVENVFGPLVIKETLARVLFHHFEVASVLFVPSHMIALSTLAVSTSLIVDIGYKETTVVPVFCGVQLLQCFQDQAYGGRALHEEIKRQLLAAGAKTEHLTECVLEDIKVRTCFVTTLERAQIYRNGQVPEQQAPDIPYALGSEEVINIPGRLRETVFEIMFEQNNDRDSLPHLILKSILRCPLDVRKLVTESIFLIGGSAIIMGLLARLKSELLHLLQHDEEYKQKLFGEVNFKFPKTIGRQNFTAWLGASLCGGTDLVHSRSLTKEMYLKRDHVPDWVCLSDNRLAG